MKIHLVDCINTAHPKHRMGSSGLLRDPQKARLCEYQVCNASGNALFVPSKTLNWFIRITA